MSVETFLAHAHNPDLLRATYPSKTLTLARASRWRLRHPSKLLITTHHYRWWQRSLFGHHLSCDVINFFKPRPLFNSSANAAIWLVERLARHFLLAPDWLGPPKSVLFYYCQPKVFKFSPKFYWEGASIKEMFQCFSRGLTKRTKITLNPSDFC